MKYFILVTISILVSAVKSLYTHSLETSLRNETFIDNAYNKDTRPATKTAIKCNIKLLSLKDINTRDQTMTTVAYFSFTWIDPRLAWDTKPAYATDIERIFSTEPALFTPSMVVENSISDLGVISDVTLPIKIDKDGTVTWTPGNVYETSCDIDTTFYPFDKQTCSIVLTTRGYTSKELELALDKKPIVLTAYQENGEWTLLSVSYDTTLTSRDLLKYSQITFSFTFQRRPAYHVMTTIIPMFLLALLSCYVFKLPVDAGEKLGYCLTVLLAFAVYLTLVSDNIPTTSTTVCYLSVYLLLMLGCGVSTVLLTIHIIDIYLTPEEEQIPKYLLILTKSLSKLVCWKHGRICGNKNQTSVSVYNVKNGDIEPETLKGHLEDCNKEDAVTWKIAAKVLDIFLFRVYIIVVLSLSALFICLMYLGPPW